METKCGYVALIGEPNVGKSTLLNALVGTKLSIVTPKPQTTRKRVVGVRTDEDSQMIFLDTPGIVEPRYELHRVMMQYVDFAIAEADIIGFMIDVAIHKDPAVALTEQVKERLKTFDKTLILILNKIDLLKDSKEVLPIIEEYNKLGLFREFVPISATKLAGVDELIKVFKQYLPEGEFLYEEDVLSTQSERFFVSELIREKLFTMFKDEVPYSTEVQIVDFKEREKGKWYISAEIIVEKETQKPLIIGAGGSRIKKLGEITRKEIENHLGVPVYLELFVKVRKNWRNNKNYLKFFGY
ncbi:GTPase Era [Bacteroidetes/Chlorobi group bacterium MS-B_bin-24]|jgi:GTP-binding protein Era|nr:MAG: GTPase Era [Bacteroidetes/Chlorobi group bacterium MS-B_bin-24]